MGATLLLVRSLEKEAAMANSTCETIRLGLDSIKPGVNVQVISNGQSLKATCAAMAATYYWALWREAARQEGKISAEGYLAEVRHV
jgi:acetyl-CoA acetyltransferase